MPTLLDKDGVLLDASTIRFERLLPGPIERIWAYLTESEKRKQWFAAGDYELKQGGKANLFFHHKNISRPGTTPPSPFGYCAVARTGTRNSRAARSSRSQAAIMPP